MQPLFEYARESATTPHPLEMAGFDNEHGARGAELLTEMLERVLDLRLSPRPLTKDVERVRALLPRAAMQSEAPAAGEPDRLAQRESLRGLLALADPVEGRTPEEDFALETLRAALVFEDVIQKREQGLRTRDLELMLALGKARDAEMARLLIWQAEHRFPDRKIMLVGASTHFVRSEQGIPRLRAPMGAFLGELQRRGGGEVQRVEVARVRHEDGVARGQRFVVAPGAEKLRRAADRRVGAHARARRTPRATSNAPQARFIQTSAAGLARMRSDNRAAMRATPHFTGRPRSA